MDKVNNTMATMASPPAGSKIEGRNMYGYTDYHGPGMVETTNPQELEEESDDDDDWDPLRPGRWMEGDSLAPPCGTSIKVVHGLLEFLSLKETDVLYDFGCGDGRICLEAFFTKHIRAAIGVEVEDDLIQRFQHLIDTHTTQNTNDSERFICAIEQDLRTVLLTLIDQCKEKEENRPEEGTASATTRQQYLLEKKLTMPTVIVLYLLPEALAEIEPFLIELLEMLPDLKILCNTWGLPSLQPTSTKHVTDYENSTILQCYTQGSLLLSKTSN
jgi:hypothetical protein